MGERHGYTENELEYLCSFYPGLINTVYAMDNSGRPVNETPLRLIQYYISKYHSDSLIVGDYEIANEYLQLLRDLEVSHDYLHDRILTS